MSEPEYTLEETIEELQGWRRGASMFPIEVAFSSVHWLEKAPSTIDGGDTEPSLQNIIDRLNEWLLNDEPYLPDAVCLGALHWLRRAKAYTG